MFFFFIVASNSSSLRPGKPLLFWEWIVTVSFTALRCDPIIVLTTARDTVASSRTRYGVGHCKVMQELYGTTQNNGRPVGPVSTSRFTYCYSAHSTPRLYPNAVLPNCFRTIFPSTATSIKEGLFLGQSPFTLSLLPSVQIMCLRHVLRSIRILRSFSKLNAKPWMVEGSFRCVFTRGGVARISTFTRYDWARVMNHESYMVRSRTTGSAFVSSIPLVIDLSR